MYSFKQFAASVTVLIICFTATLAQKTAPRELKMLNGMRVILVSEPNADIVRFKLRINAGSAFDLLGKEGAADILASMIFPNIETREYFKEELGGYLEVNTNHDLIEITAASKPDRFLTALETIANAVSRVQIDKTTFQTAQKAHLDKLSQTYGPRDITENAVNARLLGDHPYGRPVHGTRDTVLKLDFADIIRIKDRILNADNSAIAISGKIDSDLTYRALRRFFGNWTKSDKPIAFNFSQANAPLESPKVISLPKDSAPMLAFAMRGVARRDVSFPSALALAEILQKRVRAAVPANKASTIFVAHSTNVLPGIMQIVFTNTAGIEYDKTLEAADILMSAFSKKISAEEFAAAKRIILDARKELTETDLMLDEGLYKIDSVQMDSARFSDLDLATVQAFLDKFSKQPMASIIAVPEPEAVTN